MKINMKQWLIMHQIPSHQEDGHNIEIEYGKFSLEWVFERIQCFKCLCVEHIQFHTIEN